MGAVGARPRHLPAVAVRLISVRGPAEQPGDAVEEAAEVVIVAAGGELEAGGDGALASYHWIDNRI